MKIFLLSLLMTTSVMANEYVQRGGVCKITADVQDYYNPAKKLPFSLTLDFTYAYLKNTGALVATRYKSSTESHNTAPAWAEAVVEKIENSITVDSTFSGATLNRFDLTQEQVNALLVYLGSYRAQDLPNEFPSATIELNVPGTAKKQVHTTTDYGLSFHIYIECSFDQSHPRPGQGQELPPQQGELEHVCTYHLQSKKGGFLRAFSTRSRRMDWACGASKRACIKAAHRTPGVQNCYKKNTFL